MKEKALIYGLRASTSHDYFYVGSTVRSLAIRLRDHLCNARLGYNRNGHLTSKLKQVGHENVVIETLEETDAATRFEREYWWIAQLKAQGARLTNIRLTPYPPKAERTLEECKAILESGSAADPNIEFIRQMGLRLVASWEALSV